MCGIAGIAGEEEQIAKKLMLMTQSQIHRGNDFEDLWTDLFLDAGIGLSHNRRTSLFRMKIPDWSLSLTVKSIIIQNYIRN